ncbi:MAG TPA: PPC domain-containing DNA-binding protein [Candidatus Limnocylindrales bacterium]|nr:PPC domain-containing DNA-binding protein [Candidatus Limnocylindrales bacterium]
MVLSNADAREVGGEWPARGHAGRNPWTVQVLELSQEPLRTFAIVFDPGDEAIAGLAEAARRLRLDAAHFTAIGAFERATIGWFDLEARDYRRNVVNEQVEVVSLVGDVTRARPEGDELKIHGHAVLGRSDGTTLGGHLLEGFVRPTLEVVITETPAELRRRHDPTTGLALIDLDGSSGS